jgi:hypothetical protein
MFDFCFDLQCVYLWLLIADCDIVFIFGFSVFTLFYLIKLHEQWFSAIGCYIILQSMTVRVRRKYYKTFAALIVISTADCIVQLFKYTLACMISVMVRFHYKKCQSYLRNTNINLTCIIASQTVLRRRICYAAVMLKRSFFYIMNYMTILLASE